MKLSWRKTVDWDNQMLFFLKRGNRVIAHDRRGHGRSSQVPTATTSITMRTEWPTWMAFFKSRCAVSAARSHFCNTNCKPIRVWAKLRVLPRVRYADSVWCPL
jgi:pimeloyl-ACP methyl ester carboxylesterase